VRLETAEVTLLQKVIVVVVMVVVFQVVVVVVLAEEAQTQVVIPAVLAELVLQHSQAGEQQLALAKT
jgi:hypothetical protein